MKSRCLIYIFEGPEEVDLFLDILDDLLKKNHTVEDVLRAMQRSCCEVCVNLTLTF